MAKLASVMGMHWGRLGVDPEREIDFLTQVITS